MKLRIAGSLLLGTLLTMSPAQAWNLRGHHRVAEAAVEALPDEIPPFFRWGAGAVAHTAIDPDVMKSRDTPHLGHQEFPEHFLDLELLGGATLPEMRYDYVAEVIELGQAPERVGFVPYAITEGTERLSLAFAEYRCWPGNPHVRNKALVYAGLLAHYAGDMNQPLHTSVHYDGRADAEGNSPRSGIHRRVDGLFEQEGFAPGEAAIEPRELGEIWPAVVAEFMASHAQVDRVYDLEPKLAILYDDGAWDPELVIFAAERYHRSVEFLASLYWSAWRRSADVDLMSWLERRGPTGDFKGCPELREAAGD